jgi:hypothetical protein
LLCGHVHKQANYNSMDRLIIDYDPNTGNIEINSQGFEGSMSEIIGVLAVAQFTIMSAETSPIPAKQITRQSEVVQTDKNKKKYDA